MGDWMQFDQLKRRKFIMLLGGAAMSWPLAARSQQADRMPLIGVLIGYAEDDPEVKARLAAFRAGLAKRGWLEGRNVQIEYRFAAGSSNQHASFAKELIALRPDVILAHSTPVTAALQQETHAIPIVFVNVSDPVGSGFIASLAHPGGNITGVLLYEAGIVGKWLGLLKEIAPSLARIGLLGNPKTTPFDYFLRSAEAAATLLSVEVIPSQVEANAAEYRTRPGRFGVVAEQRTPCGTGRHNCRSSRSDHCARGPLPLAGGLSIQLFCRRGRSALLRDRSVGNVSADRKLCRPHPARRQTCRPPGASTHQIRNHDQS
jgi:ABC transporter substrate binding protein